MQTTNISPLQSMRWYYSISAKIARIVPGYTLSLISLTLVSQLSLLAASFLPLKAIILIGSPGIPEYFPEAWKPLGRENLFIGLSVAAITSYFFHLLAEKSIREMTEAGSKILLANSNKMTLFEDQENIASRAYLRFTRSLASVFFVTVTFFLLGTLYNDLMLAIFAFWLGLAALYFFMRATSKLQHEKLLKIINEAPSTVASLGFLAAFGFMIYDFLDESPPEVFAALIGVLLSRQIMHRVAIFAHDTHCLITQHLQLSALFFHAHKIHLHQGSEDANFWSLFDKENHPDVLSGSISEITGRTFVICEARWHQTGVHDIAALEVSAKCTQSGNIELFLVKIFSLKRSILAINEATLLAESSPCNLPTLPFIGAGSISEFHCHLFQWGQLKKFDPLEFKAPTYEILQRMMLTTPPPSLVKLFSRSRPLIWDRLSVSKLSHFTLAISTTKHKDNMNAFLASRENILGVLKSLPLQITNIDIANDHLLSDFEGNTFVSHWGLWSLEPVGAGWPTSKKELLRLESVFNELQHVRPAMTSVSLHAVKLSALIFTFDKLLTKQHFISASQLLPEIIGAYAQQNEFRTPETLR
ncbi:hypothetical protein J3P89_08825 [Pseudomonas sp. Z1-14]|uniref:hypothetical protein n=1 Tax=Pseudomonas sp. Z1-14 TaxID=2817409 RepID=UPI003DA7AC0C